MRPLDYFRQAGENIASAKLRTFLTALGIIIGISAVITMLAIGHGVNSAVVNAFEDLGANRLTVMPAAPRADGEGARGFGGMGMMASTLTLGDAAALRSLKGVTAVAPIVQVPATVTAAGVTLRTVVTGTSPDFAAVGGQELLDGRLFAEDSSEIVLNERAANTLFPEGPVMGAEVAINGQVFQVVGVFSNESALSQAGFGGAGGGTGAQGQGAPDAEPTSQPQLFVPVERGLELGGLQHVSQIMLMVATPDLADPVMEQGRAALRALHDDVVDFRFVSAQQLLDGFSRVFGIVTAGLAAVAGISLLVGGIGIMNIMLVSVTERTREIGIAKAIGATRKNIVLQFLLEAVLLSLLGGIIGLFVAWLGTMAAQTWLNLPAMITLDAVALAVGVSAAIGLFFGVAPAWRAARLDPIVALRHE